MSRTERHNDIRRAGGRLTGKSVLIIGASSGIGRATAIELASHGARLAISARRKDLLADVASYIGERGGVAHVADVDVRDEPSVQAVVSWAYETLGRIDVLFNNAGINVPGPADETEIVTWNLVHETNARGVWLACKHAIPRMREQGGGVIVNTSSMRAWTGNPNQAAYNASKGAVFSLTKQLAVELAPHNIRVNCICPGWIDTDYARRYFAALPDPDSARAATLAQYPLERAGTPEDVAKAVCFLASDDATYVTGHALVVDGGFTVK